jgi:transcriptional regulator with XRE-family HTH domain
LARDVETEHDMEESLGPLLTRVRLARGWSQLRVAELLCGASGAATVTRNEISRWEREERVPSRFWLEWLALVLEVRIDALESAAALTRRRRGRADGEVPSAGAAVGFDAEGRPAKGVPVVIPRQFAAER